MAEIEAVKGQRITGAARTKLGKDLLVKYDKGDSVRTLAESIGRSYGFVHRVLDEAGAVMRPRGGEIRARSVRPNATAAGTAKSLSRNARTGS